MATGEDHDLGVKSGGYLRQRELARIHSWKFKGAVNVEVFRELSNRPRHDWERKHEEALPSKWVDVANVIKPEVDAVWCKTNGELERD